MSIERQIISDGFKMDIAINEPTEPDIAPDTAIILCPGYLDSMYYPHLTALAKASAGAGLLAARLDPVGTWNSGGTEADYSVSQYLSNVKALGHYITDTYGIEDTDMIIGGHSLGGLLSMIYAAQEQTSVRAVIALCAPEAMTGTAHPTWQQDGVRRSDRPLPDGTGVRTYKVPWDFAIDSSQPKYSALASVKSPRYRNRNLPFFSLAGGQDKVVPVKEVEDTFLAVQGWGRKRFEVIADMEHDYRNSSQHVKLVTNKVMDWLKAGIL